LLKSNQNLLDNKLKILFIVLLFYFLEEKFSKLSKQNTLLENEKEMLSSNIQRVNTVNQNLEFEKRELYTLLEKRTKENDRLNGNRNIAYLACSLN
jgi:hypothetical protein